MKWKSFALAFFLVAVWWIIPSAPVRAQSQSTQYCHENSCFATLAEAETFMKAKSSYGAYFQRAESAVRNVYSSTPSVIIKYVVPDQPYSKIYPHGYANGWRSDSGFCSQPADPYVADEGGLCADEGEMIANILAYTRSVYPECTFFGEHTEGEYGEPFVYSRPAGTHGLLRAQEGGPRKWLKYEGICYSYHNSYSYPLSRFQNYECPVGFYPITGFNPAYNSSGNPDYVALWPNVCTAGQVYAYIEVRSSLGITQTSSCPANDHPCFPATGDKFRAEEDFVFAGLPFVRYYHSLQQLGVTSYMPTGWGHSYTEMIRSDVGWPYMITADGYFEKFKQIAERRYRGFRNSGDFLSQASNGAWTLTKSSGEVRRYNTSGQLTSVSYPGVPERTAILGYQAGRLARVTDGLGRAITFSYDKSFLSFVTLSDGSSVHYEYDSEHNLVAAVRSDGTRRSYFYNETGAAPASIRHLLTGIAEDGVRYASFTYGLDGRVASSGLHAGAGVVEKTTLQYTSSESATVVKPNGTSYDYTIGAGAFRQVTGIRGPGVSRTHAFTVDGRPTASVDGNGWRKTWTYSDALADGASSVTEVEAEGTERQRSRVTTRDANNRIVQSQTSTTAGTIATTRYAYTADGALAAQCAIDPSSTVATAYVCGSSSTPPTGVRQQLRAYCSTDDVAAGGPCPIVGLLKRQDGARTDLVDAADYTYYPSDDATCATSPTTCPHRKGDLWKVANTLGQVTEYLSYDGAGRVLSMKDANGVITDYTYHPRGWLTASKARGSDDTSESDDRITLLDYWPTGLVKQVTQPDGAFTTFTYDTAHRLTDIADNAGNTLHYTLDNAGNRVKEDIKDASGTLKRTLSRIYNQLGQLATQATASGNPTDFGYDANGNAKTVTDALGHVNQNDYDPLNRLARTLQDVGGIAAETKFGYNALDNLTRVTDPKGLDTTYAYNGLGDLTTLTSPDTGTTAYTYDSAGNRASQTDARNVTATYSYDSLNRLIQVAYPTSSLNVTYTYDVSQTVCASGETYAVGRLARMQDASGTTDYCYDRFGDVVRKVQTTNGKVFVLRYAYTKAGQLSRLTYPDGAAVDYVRNAQGQTTEVGVTPAGGTRQVLLVNATYYPFGPVASWSYGNGRPMQRVLDQDYRPLAISDTRSDGLSTGFAFDPAGNLSALTAAGNTAPVVSLDYDALGRLTAFKDGPTGTVIDGYSYDATGNRLSAKVNTATQSYTYPTTSHRLSAVAGTARTYDAIGNTLSIGGTAREFVYDTNGRMAQAKRAGAAVMNYQYNGRGEQVRKFLGTAGTYTLYDETGHWLGDYDSTGQALQQAIWLDDLPVGVLASNGLHYVQPDHLGTPRAVIDPVRDVAIWKWDLKGEAFGNTPPNQDPDSDGTAFVFDMRFPGQRYDVATGLNQNYFRDYDPGTGRYAQSDPIGLGGGLSTYSYVGGNPASYIDLLGLLRFHSWVQQKYPSTVDYLNSIKDRMTQRKYDGFARFGNIGKEHLDHLLDPCDGPVVTPEYMRHDNGRYKQGGGEILVHQSYFDRYELGERSPELLHILNSTVEHELVHFTEYFWNGNRSRVEEGWYYENYVYGTKIPLFN
ncbi:RHS repeat-associated core domain-containing protein [Xanthomonas sp. WHRI 7945]|nr:RHS repeat-associated core domain-containing protein [Xanthomonas campestris pv. campestris]